MILAPHIRISDALRLAEEIRAAIESTAFAKAGKVTCSFGVTSCKPHDTVELITRRADAALYRAKINGRNRVESG